MTGILCARYSNLNSADKTKGELAYLILVVISGIIDFCFAIFVFGVFGYHTYILALAQTTNENLKSVWRINGINPFKKLTKCKNCCSAINRKIKKGFLQYRYTVSKEKEEGDFAQGQKWYNQDTLNKKFVNYANVHKNSENFQKDQDEYDPVDNKEFSDDQN